MSNFKGFGTPPQEPSVTLIQLEANTEEEWDRAMRSYLRQGLSPERAMNCLAASVMFLEASNAGMVEGVDYHWGEKGAYMSQRMAEWAKSFASPQAWNYLEMEGFVTTVEPEPDVRLTPMGLVKLALANARDNSNPDIDAGKAQSACLDLLQAAGFDPPVAQRKLQQFLSGDLPEEELLEQVAAGFERFKNMPEGEA